MLHYLEPHSERALMLVPVGAKHLETTYLGGGAHVLAYAGTDVVVPYSDQAYRLAGIGGQAVEGDVGGQAVAGDELEGHGQVVGYQGIHATLNLLLLLAAGLVVEVEAHLALLPLYMGIIAAPASEQLNHGAIEQVLGGVGGGILLLVVVVEYVVH